MLLKAARERNIKELLVQTTKACYELGRVDGLARGGRWQYPRLMLLRMVQTRPDVHLDEVPSLVPVSHLDLPSWCCHGFKHWHHSCYWSASTALTLKGFLLRDNHGHQKCCGSSPLAVMPGFSLVYAWHLFSNFRFETYNVWKGFRELWE